MATAQIPKCDGNILLFPAGYTISRAADQTLQIYPPIGSIGLGNILSIHFPLQKNLGDKLKAAFLKHIDGKHNVSFTITRASDQTFEFIPAPGSIELATALSISFPLEPNLEAKAQSAMLEHINREPVTADRLKEDELEQNLEERPSLEDVIEASMTSGSTQTQSSEECQQNLETFRISSSISSENQFDSSSVQSLGPPKLANHLDSGRLYKPPIPGTSAWDPKTGEDRKKPKRRRLGPEEREEVAQKRRDRSVCQSCRDKKIKCDPKTCPNNKLFDSNLLLDTPLSFYQGPQRRFFCTFQGCKQGSGKGFATLKKVNNHFRRMHKEFENVYVELGFNQATYQQDRDFESSTQAKGGSTDNSQLSIEQLMILGDLDGWKENDKSFQQADTLDDLVFPEDVRMTYAQYLSAQANVQDGVDLESFTTNPSSAYWPEPLFNNTDCSPVDFHHSKVLEYPYHSQYILNPLGNTEFRTDYENDPRRFTDFGFEIDFAPAPENMAGAASHYRNCQTFLRERAQTSVAPTGAEDEEEDEEKRRRRRRPSERDSGGGGGADDSDGSDDGSDDGSGDGSGNDNHGGNPGPGKGSSGGNAGASGPTSSSPSSGNSHDLEFYYWQWKTAFDAKHSPARHIQETKACATSHAPVPMLPWVR